jgi:uncharacterized protein (TIGR02186 family)
MVRGWLALLLLLPAPAAQGAELVARLSNERVSVTTAFTGENLLVFGSTEEPIGPGGDEILIVARGPTAPFVVRRKVQVLGLWFNGPSARFEEVPGFYAIAGSRAAWRLLPEAVREERALGLDAIPLASTGARAPAFRAALLALKRESRLWQEDAAEVEIAGARLFSARIPLPSTVPAGAYSVEVYLVRSRRIVAIEHLGFEVARTGTAAGIEALARGWPALYGLMCVLLAGLAGWLGSVVFRRG